ncbi:MAG: rod shape-determining protein MreD [Bacillati bacterium ANGP1]|uniref:Rod shape-determining protein MreD n=1 Tax=Candidatus Segetimicrobium genomatis TaxID=2569760 RepID=A0A537LJI6_9BACT|nr:MAG: rod shape-determining protein MreD [Terrabacteria group bacterium ANGP1]
MSRAFVYASVVVMVALVQAAWLARAQVLGAALDPLLPLAVGMGILRGAESGAVVGVAAGLLQDLLSGGGPLGVNGLSKLVVGFASGLFERSIYIENPLLPAIATFVGTLLGEVLLVIVALIVGLGVPSASALAAKMIMQALLNSAIAPLLFRGIRAIEIRLQREH